MFNKVSSPSKLLIKSLLASVFYLSAISVSNSFFWSAKPEPVIQEPLNLKQSLMSGRELTAVTSLQSLINTKSEEDSVKFKKEAQSEYLSSKFKANKELVDSLVELAWDYSEINPDIPPELILSVMQKESSLRPKITNSYGAVGLMQVVPRWHPEKIKGSESLLDPKVNVRVGTQILQEYLTQAKGDLPKALKKYSGNARNYAKDVIAESEKLVQLGVKSYKLKPGSSIRQLTSLHE